MGTGILAGLFAASAGGFFGYALFYHGDKNKGPLCMAAVAAGLALAVVGALFLGSR